MQAKCEKYLKIEIYIKKNLVNQKKSKLRYMTKVFYLKKYKTCEILITNIKIKAIYYIAA